MKLTKKKRLEKAKVKLKAKKLPKGQNVTDTSFKVRKIVLPNQLKDPKPGDIKSKLLLDIKTLISHLDHHRPQMRLLGLKGLKEIVLSHDPAEFALDFPRILDGITSMILDLYSNIRSYALDILKELLVQIPHGMLDPHFQTMKVYLIAAMTHINPYVQKDSLLMLDMMLSKAPEFMKKCVNTFLPTFLDLVSKAKDGDSERTLHDVFNKKVTAGQWREMVLSRLTKYFSILISDLQKDEKTSIHAVTAQLRLKTSATIHWNGDTPLYVAEHLQFIQGICYLSNLFGFSDSYTIDETLSDEELLKKHVNSVMPILLDSWMEAVPKANDKKGFLFGVQGLTLQFILETIINLWNCLERMEENTGKVFTLTTWFRSTYGKKITNKFISNFPYSDDDIKYTSVMDTSQNGKFLVENSVPYSAISVELNLLTCYLIECLDCMSDKNIADSVLVCLDQCLKNWKNNKSLPTLKKVLKCLLTSKNQGWPKEKILKTVMNSLKIESLKDELELILLDFVCDYIHVSGSPGQRTEGLDKWLSELPLLLLKPELPIKIVLLLRRLSSQNRELFIMNLKKYRRSIAENLFHIKFTGGSQVEGQKAVIEMLFYIRDPHIFTLLRRVAALTGGGNEDIVNFINSLEEFHLYIA